MNTIKNMMPFLMMLAAVGNSLYYLPKEFQTRIGNGYPGRQKKMSKSILTLHRKAYSNKYDNKQTGGK
jgi:hypothetical protein